jgi:hypothetical protein
MAEKRARRLLDQKIAKHRAATHDAKEERPDGPA